MILFFPPQKNISPIFPTANAFILSPISASNLITSSNVSKSQNLTKLSFPQVSP